MDFEEPQSLLSDVSSIAQSFVSQAVDPEPGPAAPAAGETMGTPLCDAMQALSLFGHYTDGAAPAGEAAPASDGQDFMGPQLTPAMAQEIEDRKQADAALAGKLHIVDGKKAKKARAGNEVTREEYEQIRKTYLDVKNGKTDLDVSNPDDLQPHQDLPESQAWVLGMTPEELRAKNAADREAYEQARATAQQRVMNDVGTMMETKAGRELVARLSNNVDPTDPTRHLKTTLRNAPDDAQGWDSGEAAASSGAHDATSYYAAGQPGSDRRLFAALTGALHTTSGTRQRGQLGDDDGRAWDAGGRAHAVDDRGRVARADVGRDRERAAIIGLDGYGTRLHGESITENQYDREQRQNGGGASMYPQFDGVDAEDSFDHTGRTRR